MISFFKDSRFDWFHFFSVYQKYVKKTDTVLELGASFVEKTDLFANYCQKLVGIEYQKDRVPKDHKNIRYLQGDWQSLSKTVSPNSIDLLVSNHTIEHVSNDLKAINETYLVLKKDGIALLNTPNRNRLARVFIELFTGKRVFPYWEHQREYTEEDLISLISKSSFTKYKITPVIFGIYNGYIGVFTLKVPSLFRKWANIWEIELYK